MKKICLAGYSGHGFVVAEIINLLQHNLVAYIDIEEKKHDPFSLKYLGNENELDLSFLKRENMYVALGAGDNSIRKKIYNLLKEKDLPVETLLHPKAVVSSLSTLGEGTVVMSSAIINPFARIGKAVICNSGCIIEHECLIGDFAHIAPGAVLAGNVVIGHTSFVGANAFIKQGLTIGSNSIIGAGSVVLSNVPDNVVIYGNPAKIKKHA